MPNLKFINAPLNIWCGDSTGSGSDVSGCNTNQSANFNCVYYKNDRESDLTKCSAGYKHSTWDDEGCSGATWNRECEKDENSDHWNPLGSQYKDVYDNEGTADPKLIKQIYNCCYDKNLFSNSDKEECGDLYDGVSDGNKYCENILSDYCKSNPDELLDNSSECYKYAITNDEWKSDNMHSICKGKETDKKWDSICACYKPDSFYLNILSSLTEQWNFPPEYGDPTPECIYPMCKSSKFKNNNTMKVCDSKDKPSFATCVQDFNVDTKGLVAGRDIILKSEIKNCGSTFTPKGGGKSSSTIINGRKTDGDSPETKDLEPDDDKKKSKNTKIGIGIGVSLFFIIIIVIAVVMSGGGEDGKRSRIRKRFSKQNRSHHRGGGDDLFSE
jgi:hypothetical protein